MLQCYITQYNYLYNNMDDQNDADTFLITILFYVIL